MHTVLRVELGWLQAEVLLGHGLVEEDVSAHLRVSADRFEHDAIRDAQRLHQVAAQKAADHLRIAAGWHTAQQDSTWQSSKRASKQASAERASASARRGERNARRVDREVTGDLIAD